MGIEMSGALGGGADGSAGGSVDGGCGIGSEDTDRIDGECGGDGCCCCCCCPPPLDDALYRDDDDEGAVNCGGGDVKAAALAILGAVCFRIVIGTPFLLVFVYLF